MVKRKKKKELTKADWLNLLTRKAAVRKNIRKQDEYVNAVKKISIDPLDDPLSPEDRKKILTGTALDRILSVNGGIESGSSMMVWGEFATGKTQIIESMIIESAETGLVILIDAEGTYRKHRLREIALERGKDPDKISKNMRIYQPQDWIEQEGCIYNLPEYDKDDNIIKVNLVALDSLMKHFTETKEFQGRENMGQRAGILGSELGELQRYCRRHDSVLVFSNQVRQQPVAKMFVAPENAVYPPGGFVVRHFPDYNVFLRKGPRNIRFARLIDSPDLPLMEVPFILSKGGIRDIPDPADRIIATELGDKFGTKWSSSRMTQGEKAGKKWYKKAFRLGSITEEEAIEHEWLTQKEIDTIKAQITDSMSDDNTLSTIHAEIEEEAAETLAMIEEESKRVWDNVGEESEEESQQE